MAARLALLLLVSAPVAVAWHVPEAAARPLGAARARSVRGVCPLATTSPRPAPELTIPGDTLDTLPHHVGFTLAHGVLVAGVVAHGLAVEPLATSVALGVAVVVGDVASAVIHWGTDNYGDINTPVVGTVCAAFQGHHKAPWTITHRSFFNNVHKIARTALAPTALAAVALTPPAAAFVAALLFSQLLAQEFHRWSHCLPQELAPWQLWLQESGLVLSRGEHLRHHASPFHDHYAILIGKSNALLDRTGVFRFAEAVVYRWRGVVPNCWKDDKGGDGVRALALGTSAGGRSTPPRGTDEP